MTVPLNTLFSVTYGNKLDLNKLSLMSKEDGGVNFVGRSSQRHGVSGIVARIDGVEPYPAGCITVALGGSRLLTSFVQLEPFYTAQNVAVLTPLGPMSMVEKIYICICIPHNRFRYSAFGREANRTLRTLPVPALSEFPKWLKQVDISSLDLRFSSPAAPNLKPTLNLRGWNNYRFQDLFDLQKGRRLTKANSEHGETPFIAAIDSNNGIRQFVSAEPMHPANVLTVNYNGSVAEAFYQAEPFYASDDVNVLYPKFEMDELIGLFICTIIRREKYRFNYGRKWNLERMNVSILRLPSQKDGSLDVERIRAFMERIPYTSALRIVEDEVI